jgi:hypothetical protein
MYISIHQACILWDALRDAMIGKASHGFETEIYAYTLMPSIPSLNPIGLNLSAVNHNANYIKAAQALVEIVNLFQEQHPNISAFIDGYPTDLWLKEISANFKHRVKVEIRTLSNLSKY